MPTSKLRIGNRRAPLRTAAAVVLGGSGGAATVAGGGENVDGDGDRQVAAATAMAIGEWKGEVVRSKESEIDRPVERSRGLQMKRSVAI